MSQILSIYYTDKDNFFYTSFGDELDIAIMKKTFYLDDISYDLKEFFKYIINNKPKLMTKYQEDLKWNGPGNGAYSLYLLIHESGYYSIRINPVIENMLKENIDREVREKITEIISNIRKTLARPQRFDS